MAEELIVYRIDADADLAIGTYRDLIALNKRYRQELLDATDVGSEGFEELRQAIKSNQQTITAFNRDLRNSKSIAERITEGTIAAFKQVGITIAAAFSIDAVADYAREINRLTGEINTGFARVNTVAQLSQSELANLRDQAIEAGTESGTALENIPDALFDIVSGTGDVNLSLEILNASLRATDGGFGDLSSTASAGVGILNAVGRDIEGGIGRVFDVLFATQRDGVLTFDDLSNRLPNIIAPAKAVGFELDEVASALATVTKQGTDVRRAETALRSLFTVFQQETKRNALEEELAKVNSGIFDTEGNLRPLIEIVGDFNKVLETANTDAERTEIFSNLGFDQESVLALTNLTNGLDDFVEIQDNVTNSVGEANRQYELSENRARDLAIETNELKQQMFELGNDVAPTVTEAKIFLLNALTSLLSGIRSFFGFLKENDGVAAAFRVGVAAIAAILVSALAPAIGTAATAIRAFTLSLNLSPIGLFTKAVTLAVVAYEAFSAISKEVNEDLEIQKQLTDDVVSAIRSEREEVDTLFKVINDNQTTREQQSAALQKVLKQYPEQLGNIETETKLLGSLDVIQKRINENILQNAIAQIKADKVKETTNALIQKQIEIEQKRLEIQNEQGIADERLAEITGNNEIAARIRQDALRDVRIAQSELAKLQEEQNQLTQDQSDFNELLNNSFLSLSETVDNIDFSTAFNGLDLQIEDSEKKLDALNNALAVAAVENRQGIQDQIFVEEERLNDLLVRRQQIIDGIVSDGESGGGVPITPAKISDEDEETIKKEYSDLVKNIQSSISNELDAANIEFRKKILGIDENDFEAIDKAEREFAEKRKDIRVRGNQELLEAQQQLNASDIDALAKLNNSKETILLEFNERINELDKELEDNRDAAFEDALDKQITALQTQAENLSEQLQIINLEFQKKNQELLDSGLSQDQIDNLKIKEQTEAIRAFGESQIQSVEDSALASARIAFEASEKSKDDIIKFEQEKLQAALTTAEERLKLARTLGDVEASEIDKLSAEIAKLKGEIKDVGETPQLNLLESIFGIKEGDTEIEGITKIISSTVGFAQQALSAYNDFARASFQAAINQIDTSLEQATNRLDDLKATKELLDAEILEATDSQINALERQKAANDANIKAEEKAIKDLNKEKAKIEAEEAQRAKRAAIFQITLNTIQGVANAVAQSPLTFGLPFSAFVALTGAAQLALAQNAKYKDGGLLEILKYAFGGLVESAIRYANGGNIFPAKNGGMIKGKSHSLGGVKFRVRGERQIREAEGGEFIVNRRATRMFYDEINAINEAGKTGNRLFRSPVNFTTDSPRTKSFYQDGGVVGVTQKEESTVTNAMLDKLDQINESVQQNKNVIFSLVEFQESYLEFIEAETQADT